MEKSGIEPKRTKSSVTIHPAEWTDITNTQDPVGDRMFGEGIKQQDIAPEAGLPVEIPPVESSPYEDNGEPKSDKDVLEDH